MKKETILLIVAIFAAIMMSITSFMLGYYWHKEEARLQSGNRPGQVDI